MNIDLTEIKKDFVITEADVAGFKEMILDECSVLIIDLKKYLDVEEVKSETQRITMWRRDVDQVHFLYSLFSQLYQMADDLKAKK